MKTEHQPWFTCESEAKSAKEIELQKMMRADQELENLPCLAGISINDGLARLRASLSQNKGGEDGGKSGGLKNKPPYKAKKMG